VISWNLTNSRNDTVASSQLECIHDKSFRNPFGILLGHLFVGSSWFILNDLQIQTPSRNDLVHLLVFVNSHTTNADTQSRLEPMFQDQLFIEINVPFFEADKHQFVNKGPIDGATVFGIGFYSERVQDFQAIDLPRSPCCDQDNRISFYGQAKQKIFLVENLGYHL